MSFICRLSQAHCRLMYRSTILPMDAIIAVSLVDLSMQDCTLNDTVDALHSTFQRYPDFDYLCLAKKLLSKLNLYEIWQNELLYYGKLLHIDHKTLERDIDNGNHQIFAKYDDLSDENTPLSSTLVTSSYFNNKKGKVNEDDIFIEKEGVINENKLQDNKVNERLAATLKKHAAMNKNEQKPPINQRKARKRKTVVANVSSLIQKKTKRLKKSKSKSESDDSDSDGGINTNQILNAVPSVNDVFRDLGIDFNFDKSTNNEENEEDKKFREISRKNIAKDIFDNVNESSLDLDDKRLTEKGNEMKEQGKENVHNPSNTLNKLKQFQFREKHDLSKFYEEKPNVPQEEAVVKLEKGEDSFSSDSINKKPSVSSSQISMFESSDCDIDLDI